MEGKFGKKRPFPSPERVFKGGPKNYPVKKLGGGDKTNMGILGGTKS